MGTTSIRYNSPHAATPRPLGPTEPRGDCDEFLVRRAQSVLADSIAPMARWIRNRIFATTQQ